MRWQLRTRASTAARAAAKVAFASIGGAISGKRGHDWHNVANYIPFEETIAAAASAGLSVGDYIDGTAPGKPSATRQTIDEMARLGVFDGPIAWVVEIGAGSGRYVERTINACQPKRYEIYETAAKWAGYVAERYHVIWQPTDGKTLAATPDNSVDLVQAHKVFSTVSFLVSAHYWLEMARVARPGGFAVFDIVTESCMSTEQLEVWVASGIDNGSYPAVIPRGLATEFFAKHGFALRGSFTVPMRPGRTETFVFQKSARASLPESQGAKPPREDL